MDGGGAEQQGQIKTSGGGSKIDILNAAAKLTVPAVSLLSTPNGKGQRSDEKEERGRRLVWLQPTRELNEQNRNPN